MIPLAKLAISEAEIEQVVAVLRSGAWASGGVVADFEKEFADYCRINHAVAVSNGTVALQAAMEVLGIGRGTFVITTPFTFIATSAAIVAAGAIPVFVDIDPDTFLIDMNQLDDAVSKFQPAAACIVHLYGQACDGAALREISEHRQIPLVEDCAQAQGATWCGEHVGSFGSLGTHSFYATKNLPTGEGGMVVANDGQVAERVRRLANHGRLVGYEHIEIGYNYRLTNIAASLGRGQLKRLDDNNSKRIANATRFRAEITSPWIKHPCSHASAHHVYHQYTISSDYRDELKAYLEGRGVSSAIVYPKLSYQQESFRSVTHVNLGCPKAEVACRKVLSIPVHPGLKVEDVDKIVEACNDFRPERVI